MLYVSPSCERITGYKPEEFLKDSLLFEKIIHPEDKKSVTDTIKKLFNKKTIIALDFRIIRTGGEIRWIGHISQPVYGNDRRPLGRRASNRDISENKKIENRLKESQAKLHEQNIALEQKNIAFKELVDQIEFQRRRIKKNISINIEKLVVPVVNRIKSLAKDEMLKKYADILEKTILEINSSFGSKIADYNLKLTMKELEICNLIKNGFSSKEISDVLNLSLRTIETHRKNIRKKLNILNSNINLSNYLHNYQTSFDVN
jgi:PAS domain S-box-containing protein